jgi:hypothetical protein
MADAQQQQPQQSPEAETINNKYGELCARRGHLTFQMDVLKEQLDNVDMQIKGLDVALNVVTQLQAPQPGESAGELPVPSIVANEETI